MISFTACRNEVFAMRSCFPQLVYAVVSLLQSISLCQILNNLFYFVFYMKLWLPVSQIAALGGIAGQLSASRMCITYKNYDF